jgi:hypothetical protein
MKTIKSPLYGTDYKVGSIMFSKHDGNLISEGISELESAFEISSFLASHVWGVKDGVTGIEASADGIQEFPLSKYIANPAITCVVRNPRGMTSATCYLMLSYADSFVGKLPWWLAWVEYDYPALLLGYPIEVLMSKIIPGLVKYPPPFHVPGAHVCSTLWADALFHTFQYHDEQMFKDFHVTECAPNILWNRFPWEPFKFEGGDVHA